MEEKKDRSYMDFLAESDDKAKIEKELEELAESRKKNGTS